MQRIILFLTSFLLSCMTVLAQNSEIIYEELDLIHVGGWELDFDHNEGAPDLHIHWENEYGQHSFTITNMVFVDDGEHFGWGRSPWFFKRFPDLGDTISNIAQWQATWSRGYESAFEKEGYLALRHVLPDGNSCYGWLRYRSYILESDMTNNGHGWIDFYEYAYCTEPGYPLRVGQTSYDWGVGQQEETAGLIVQPNPTSGMVAITGSDLERVEVFNPMGQRIESKPIHSDASSFDLSAFPSGVYLLNVADKHGRHCIKKIVIQH